MTKGIYNNVCELVGQTPLILLQKLRPEHGARILAKLELKNPGGSIKDRAALSMIKRAEDEGQLKKGATIVEATSGNTGISLAMIAAVRGYGCVVVMPEDMSSARRYVLKAYGAEVVLTPALQGMAGAVAKAEEIRRQRRGSFMPRQFENPANPDIHFRTTAEEIWASTEGKVDAFVAGVGTGGTLTGVGEFIKQKKLAIQIVAVEPKGSSVLSGGEPGLHGIQGIGAGFVPRILNSKIIDRILQVSDLDAERMTRRLAKEEGLLLGPSSGANVHAAVEVAKTLDPTNTVVTILCDTGERYLC